MAEGFEPYHVPQQSRRDKLRVLNNHPPGCVDNLHTCAPLAPLYDPSLISSSDFINSANLHRHSYPAHTGVKEEGMNLMSFLGAMAPNHMYVDPYAYTSLVLDQSFHGGQNGNNTANQSLSLSLSSHHSNNLPLELNLQRYGNGNEGSRFLKPAQQLLEELCVIDHYADKDGGVDSSLLDPPSLSCGDDSVVDCSDGGERTRKKSRLLSLLHEVYKRYKQYYQQMQAAVAAFESVAGLSNAAPFANLALKAMSKHFRCLKNTITDQLHFTSKSHGSERDEVQRPENLGQRSFHAGFVHDQPVWRPQRGLPERAVTVLRAWLFDHFLHPYPTDTDKIMLAKQTGLSRNQVSNWFINARVRLWKPMVEEIHMLETRQSQKSSHRDEQQQPPNVTNSHLPTSCSMECQNASTSIEFPMKRTREDPSDNQGQMKLSYENLLRNNPGLGVGLSNGGNGNGNGGVSLTLGLHQNGGVGLSDSYPMNAARRFGLDSQGDHQGYVVSGFAVQNRQFGRDIIDGQIMHDFVG